MRYDPTYELQKIKLLKDAPRRFAIGACHKYRNVNFVVTSLNNDFLTCCYVSVIKCYNKPRSFTVEKNDILDIMTQAKYATALHDFYLDLQESKNYLKSIDKYEPELTTVSIIVNANNSISESKFIEETRKRLEEEEAHRILQQKLLDEDTNFLDSIGISYDISDHAAVKKAAIYHRNIERVKICHFKKLKSLNKNTDDIILSLNKKNVRRSHCYSCHTVVSSITNMYCSRCGYLVCNRCASCFCTQGSIQIFVWSI